MMVHSPSRSATFYLRSLGRYVRATSVTVDNAVHESEGCSVAHVDSYYLLVKEASIAVKDGSITVDATSHRSHRQSTPSVPLATVARYFVFHSSASAAARALTLSPSASAERLVARLPA